VTATKKGFKKKSGNYIEDIVEISSSVRDEESKGDQYTDSCIEKDDSEKKKQEPSLSKKELFKRLEKTEREKQEISDRLLRTMAEFENYKKRVVREKEDLIKYGTEKFACELLAVVDNFERALEQAKSAEEIQPVVEGIEMILKQFVDVLEKFHVTSFDSVGEPFDPQKHEAMAQQEHNEHEENTVISEFQKGYYLRDRLLRPARVIVSKNPPKNDEEGLESGEEKENKD
jgi:molecular chaperone GrpE